MLIPLELLMLFTQTWSVQVIIVTPAVEKLYGEAVVATVPIVSGIALVKLMLPEFVLAAKVPTWLAALRLMLA